MGDLIRTNILVRKGMRQNPNDFGAEAAQPLFLP